MANAPGHPKKKMLRPRKEKAENEYRPEKAQARHVREIGQKQLVFDSGKKQ